jgi:hypothetical protein
MNIEIRDNVPIPPKLFQRPRGRQRSSLRLIIEKLHIGQSFEIEHPVKKNQLIYSMCKRVNLDTTRQFTVRKLRDGDKKGTAVYGVWRIT